MPSVNVPGVGQLNFPDGMSQADMSAAIEKNFPTQMAAVRNKAQVQGWVKDAKTPTAFEAAAVPVGAALSDTGRSIGHLANLVAGAQSPGGMAAATTANTADQDQTDAQEQPARDAAFDANPRTYAGLYAPASVLSMAPLGEGVGGAASEAAAALPKLAGALTRSAATGAAYGAQTPGDTVKNTAAGALLGPVADAALSGLGAAARAVPGATNAVKTFGSKLFQPDAAAQNTVQDIIQASKQGAPAAAAPSIPGTAFTQGGNTLDPGVQSLEQAVRQRVSGNSPNEAIFQAQQRQNNSAIHDAINGVEDSTAPATDTSTAAHAALQSARDSMSDQEGDLWKQIPMSTPVDAAKTSAAVDGFINKQTVTNQRIIQRTAGDFLDDFKAAVSKYASESDDETQVKMPFGEIKDLRSTLGQSIRDAQKAGNSNGVRLLKGIDDKLLTSLGDENAFLGVPEPTGNAALDSANAKLSNMNGTVTGQQLGDAYNTARGFTADLHGKYFTKPVQSMLDTDPAKLLDKATSTPDNFDAFLNAASQGQDKGAAAIAASRKYLLNKAMTGSSMSARGGTQPFIDGQKLGKFLNQNQAVLSKVFSGDELNSLDNSAQGAYRNIATEAANPRLGSTTIGNLFKNQGISSQVIPGVGGGANTVVTKAATGVVNKLLSKYSTKTETLLRDALLDPSANANLFQPKTQAPSGPSLVQMLRDGAGKLPLPLRVAGSAATDPKAALIRYLLQASPQQ